MKKIFPLIVFVLGASSAVGHDFWLGVSSWQVASGSRVIVTANVGDRFPDPTTYTAPERVASLELVGPGLRVPLELAFTREKDALATAVQLPPQPSTYMVAMVVKPRFIEIKPPDFTRYLTHEGLERIVREREQLKETDKPGRERYSRYAKLLVRADRGGSGGAALNTAHVARPLGWPAELVPQSDLTTHRIGDEVVLQLLFEGKPVAGALVGAINAGSKGAPDEWPLKERTDAKGLVRFRLHEPGPWLIRTVHMVRRGNEQGPEAVDWESFWASLTFDFGG